MGEATELERLSAKPLMGLDGPQRRVEDGPEPLVGQHLLPLDLESQL